MLVQVVDYSDEHHKNYIEVTMETLKELEAQNIPMILVYNKSDKAGMDDVVIQGDDKIFIHR